MFESVVYEMASILSRPQCVKMAFGRRSYSITAPKGVAYVIALLIELNIAQTEPIKYQHCIHMRPEIGNTVSAYALALKSAKPSVSTMMIIQLDIKHWL